jgi:hypothetical protein
MCRRTIRSMRNWTLSPRFILITSTLVLATTAMGAVKYHFKCDYIDSDLQGNETRRRTIDSRFIEDSAKVSWTGVTMTNGSAAPQPLAFMEGFSFPARRSTDHFAPEFFKGFPEAAIEARNLVWDVDMFQTFAARQSEVKEDDSLHLKSDNVPLAGAGSFVNSDIQLQKLGDVRFHGVNCTVISYLALANKVSMKMTGVTFTGRSHYWGNIWIDKKTGGIVYGTLYENVLGEVAIPNQAKPLNIDVLRIGSLTRE